MSVLKDTAYTLTSPTFVGADGETPTDTASTPTCTVTRANGTALTAASVTATSEDGVYTAAITTSHTSQLDRLTITWSGTAGSLAQVYTQELEVAGGWYVTIPEVRATRDLSDEARYPVADVRSTRDRFEKIAEEHCGQAFVPRYHSETLRGNNRSNLILKYPNLISILSVTVDGTAMTVGDYELDEALGLVRTDGSWFPCPSGSGRNVTVEYTHGMTVCPVDVKEECLTFLRSKLTHVVAGIPNAQMTEAIDGGRQMTFASQGAEAPTGIPSVDEVLNRRNVRIPGIA